MSNFFPAVAMFFISDFPNNRQTALQFNKFAQQFATTHRFVIHDRWTD
jgi:hypothetical protein